MQPTLLLKNGARLNGLILLLILLASLSSCKKEELTGDLSININRNDLDGVNYTIYTEAYLLSNDYVPPVKTGVIRGKVISIKGLNTGNYIMQLSAGTNWRIFLQVTAGKDRSFSVD